MFVKAKKRKYLKEVLKTRDANESKNVTKDLEKETMKNVSKNI